MARPLKVYEDTGFRGLKELTDAEIEGHISKVILEDFASDTTTTGHVKVNDSFGGTGTLIGTFIDTYRPYNVGDHPVGTNVTSTTYNFYQQLTAVAPAPSTSTRPLRRDTGGLIKEMSDSEINTDICAKVVASLAANYGGTYAMQPSAPTGGTWVSVATITNTLTPGTTNTTKLWVKTVTNATATGIRPIKSDGGGDVKELTDIEIESLTDYVRDYIRTSGIGTYRVQNGAPTGGTWITSGAAFADTRKQVSNVSYTGYYTGYYTTNYAGAYATTYILYYSGRIGGYYTSYYTGYYAHAYAGAYTGTYTGLTISSSDETVTSLKLWLRTA